MNMKRKIAVMLVLSMILGLGGGNQFVRANPRNKMMSSKGEGSQLALVVNNLARYKIAVPDDITEVERAAAAELADYIQKMTGAVMDIKTENEITGKAIYIGKTGFAKERGLVMEAGEAWMIKAVDGNLVLTGGALRGVLYSVYHLLEDQFGVHWWSPYEEYVPELNSLIISATLSETGEPAFENRDIYTAVETNRITHGWGHAYNENISASNLFYTRNRLNGTYAYAGAEYGGMDAIGAPYIVHTMGLYFPSDVFDSKPDYFAMENGVRNPNGQHCLTNENLIEETIEKIRSSIQLSYATADRHNQPRPKYFSLSLDDRMGFCQCPECSAMESAKGVSGVLLTFVNRVAQEIGKVYPEVKIETLAYWISMEPPKDNTRAENNVIIRIADNYSDLLHDLDHPNNAEVSRRLKEWSDVVDDGNLFIWRYGVNWEINPPMPTMYTYANDFRKYLEVGVRGCFVEMQHAITTDFWTMKAWMLAKLMENPYLDEEELMDTFLNGYYGDAAPYIKQYLQIMWDSVSGSTLSAEYGTDLIYNNYVTINNVIDGARLFEAALNAVSDPEITARINLARSSLDKVIASKHKNFVLAAKVQNIYDDEIKAIIDGKAAAERVIDCLEEQITIKFSDITGKDATDHHRALNQISVFEEMIPELEREAEDENAPVPNELSHINETAIFQIPSDKLVSWDLYELYGISNVEDDDSMFGEAIVMNYGSITDPVIKSYHYVDNGENYMQMFHISDGNGFLNLRRDDLISDGQYHLYKISNIRDVAQSYGRGFRTCFYVFRSWVVKIDLVNVYEIMPSKSYDVYVSMKTTGPVYNGQKGESNSVYIDRVYIVDATAN